MKTTLCRLLLFTTLLKTLALEISTQCIRVLNLFMCTTLSKMLCLFSVNLHVRICGMLLRFIFCNSMYSFCWSALLSQRKQVSRFPSSPSTALLRSAPEPPDLNQYFTLMYLPRGPIGGFINPLHFWISSTIFGISAPKTASSCIFSKVLSFCLAPSQACSAFSMPLFKRPARLFEASTCPSSARALYIKKSIFPFLPQGFPICWPLLISLTFFSSVSPPILSSAKCLFEQSRELLVEGGVLLLSPLSANFAIGVTGNIKVRDTFSSTFVPASWVPSVKPRSCLWSLSPLISDRPSLKIEGFILFSSVPTSEALFGRNFISLPWPPSPAADASVSANCLRTETSSFERPSWRDNSWRRAASSFSKSLSAYLWRIMPWL